MNSLYKLSSTTCVITSLTFRPLIVCIFFLCMVWDIGPGPLFTIFFSHFWIVFSLSWWCLWSTKVFHFDGFQFIFLFSLAFSVIYQKALSNLRSQKFTSMFSSKSFIILALTLRSMIDFELIFLYRVRKESNFIIVHLDIQLSQRYLLKRLFFPPWIVLAPLLKINWP